MGDGIGRNGRNHPSALPVEPAGVLSWKFVEERNLPKSLPGQAQSTAMPGGMARICNDAWRRLPGDLFNEFPTRDTRAC
jgi:hypothetical protein